MSTRANPISMWLAVTAISVTIGMTARDPVIASVLISVVWAAATKLLTATTPCSERSEGRTESDIIKKLHALQWMKVLFVYAVVLNVAVGWRLWSGTASAESRMGNLAESPQAPNVEFVRDQLDPWQQPDASPSPSADSYTQQDIQQAVENSPQLERTRQDLRQRMQPAADSPQPATTPPSRNPASAGDTLRERLEQRGAAARGY
jgi:hypothetical protein